MSLNRRQLIGQATRLGALALLGDWFPNVKLFAGEPSITDHHHFFVLLKTFGGMDATLGLDPQILPAGADENDMFLEYRPEQIVQAKGLRFGPAAKALVPYAGSLAVINGISMRRDAGHSPLNLYMASGRGDGKGPALPVQLALSLGAAPFGVVMNRNVYTAGKNIILTGTADLQAGVKNGELDALLEERMKAGFAKGSPLDQSQAALLAAKAHNDRLVTRMEELKTKYGKLQDRHVVAAALASGASRHAELDLTSPGSLDTHSDHEKNHLARQRSIWENTAEVFKLFQEVPYGTSTLFEATTFMVYTEFSRTPALNGAKGKDHNPFTNSVLLAGRGVRGGTTFGKSVLMTRKQSINGVPEHCALPYLFDEKKVAESKKGAHFIYPENVIQTVAQIFGKTGALEAIPAKVRPIPDVAL